MDVYSLFWSIAKRIDPERVHDITLLFLKCFPALSSLFKPIPEERVRGYHLTWKNSLGIAAGLDKNAVALDFWSRLGLGCIEIGTVTPRAQFGNDLPRITRIAPASLVNSMGFPGLGSSQVLKNILRYRAHHDQSKNAPPLWVNIGKQRDTEISDAIRDYQFLIKTFSAHADGLCINISSPNTKDLRSLQSGFLLSELLDLCAQTRDNEKLNLPLILKISPDEQESFYQDIPGLLQKYGWQGLISTNTTANHQYGKGGLSGEQLFSRSSSIAMTLAPICERHHIDFIYAGGLSKEEQILKLKSYGIRFFQLYTSLIYQGPNLFQKLSLK